MKKSVDLITAGIIFNEKKNKILLIRRSDGMWGKSWSIPGGYVEHGESVEKALLRELKEELDLKVMKTKFLSHEEFIHPKKPNIQFVSLNFIVIAKEKIFPNEEINEAKWFELSKITKIDHKIPREALEIINKFIEN